MELIIGMNLGDINGNGIEEIFVSALNGQKNRLQIFEANGWEFWTGADPFGRSLLYLNLPADNRGAVEKKSYFPMRIRIRDLNGIDELVAVLVSEEGGMIGMDPKRAVIAFEIIQQQS